MTLTDLRARADALGRARVATALRLAPSTLRQWLAAPDTVPEAEQERLAPLLALDDAGARVTAVWDAPPAGKGGWPKGRPRRAVPAPR